jgi:hypothetical protein
MPAVEKVTVYSASNGVGVAITVKSGILSVLPATGLKINEKRSPASPVILERNVTLSPVFTVIVGSVKPAAVSRDVPLIDRVLKKI